ncbi:MAG: NusG domain II-containing protein [Candidatus Cloacimonadaceae bacterium]|jgi:hypothetical protein|nr:NusG domain II-containing protein [Candidatus Cloacimonadota bacterium]MDX9949601.1 NusG domain II-containing protein [Candidatus Syntrophosphaera sp.]NLN85265.1 NusG domain II-containing protein [Candidatus Cloacimonadota bacterium]
MYRKLREHLSLADFILILTVLLAIGISWATVSKKEERLYVYIQKDELAVGVFPLDKDRVIRIDEHNTVEIKDGKVGMTEADCPDKRCVKQGFGDKLPIVCLPNRVVVEIRPLQAPRRLIVQ